VLGAAGGVGLTAVEIGKARGARVIAAAGGAHKLEVARSRGADEFIDYRSESLRDRVPELTGWGAQTERHPAWMSRTLAELLRWWEDSKLKPLIAKPFSLAEAWCGTRCPDLAALRRKGSAGDLTRRITGAARALGISRFNKPHLDAYGCGPPLTVARSRSHCPADQAQRAALMTDSSRFPSLPLPCRWLIEVVQR
jgi:hypothetical protein